MTPIKLFLVLSVFLLLGQGDEKTYEVKKAPREIEITGTGSDPLWDQAGLLTDFQLHWDNIIPQPTTFQALWTEDALYLLFKVTDHDVIAKKPEGDSKWRAADHVEIFFNKESLMNPYYCLEFFSDGQVLDYQAKYYRNLDLDWTWPLGHLVVSSSLSTDGYIVEARISMESLHQLELVEEDNSMSVGLFRGDYRNSVVHGGLHANWISWVKSDSKSPDFHVPSAFGRLLLIDKKAP